MDKLQNNVVEIKVGERVSGEIYIHLPKPLREQALKIPKAAFGLGIY